MVVHLATCGRLLKEVVLKSLAIGKVLFTVMLAIMIRAEV
jgi:hypothetical protein